MDDGPATPDGNKRTLADILSVRFGRWSQSLISSCPQGLFVGGKGMRWVVQCVVVFLWRFLGVTLSWTWQRRRGCRYDDAASKEWAAWSSACRAGFERPSAGTARSPISDKDTPSYGLWFTAPSSMRRPHQLIRRDRQYTSVMIQPSRVRSVPLDAFFEVCLHSCSFSCSSFEELCRGPRPIQLVGCDMLVLDPCAHLMMHRDFG